MVDMLVLSEHNCSVRLYLCSMMDLIIPHMALILLQLSLNNEE